MPTDEIPHETALRILKQVEIFSHVPEQVIEELFVKMLISRFKADDRIITQGERGNSMYIILQGQVKVHDREFIIADMYEGNFFGEFSLLDDEPRSLSVTAMVPSITGTILQSDFYRILNKYPDVTKDIIKVMLKRLRTQNQKIISQLRQRQKELEDLVNERTQDLRTKNEDLEHTLSELKRTQEQLVQQEKLASLGQLTAGIAHEIKNPLNFVNNFSLLSGDLIDDLLASTDEEEKKIILADLKQNLGKILQHGQRADAIVKSMLDHARFSSRSKQMTNINTLCEEYANLSLHGVQANFPKFVCTVEKNFDQSIPEIDCIPQDLAHVLLNIFNNAFYAIKDKKNGVVSVQTKATMSDSINPRKEIEIRIMDNGIGIPEANLNKVFQPFFTTKPTGQGTGLGLSVSFDIIKAHGGEIRVESKPAEFSEFIIKLPVV